MKLVIFIFIFITFMHNPIYSQKCDSTILKVASQSLKTRYFDTVLCNKYIDLGCRKIAKDSIYIPSHSFKYRFSATEEEIFVREYGFLKIDFIDSDVTPPEILCFNLLMESMIKEKWGESFFDSIKVLSDSLFKIGKGFKSIMTNSSLNKFLEIDSMRNNPNLILIIEFKVTKEGKVKSPKFYKTYLYSENNYLKIKGKLKKDVIKIFDKMEWTPSYYMGEPVSDKKWIFINESFF